MSSVQLTINRTAGIITDELKTIDQISESEFDNQYERRNRKVAAVEKRLYTMFEELSKITIDHEQRD